MEKQNRPYNLLNIFDNLHGKIKKPILENALDELIGQNVLVGKDFGKNRIYMLRQDNFKVDTAELEKLNS